MKKRFAAVSTSFELAASPVYLILVDIKGLFSVNMYLTDNIEYAQNKVNNLIKKFQQLDCNCKFIKRNLQWRSAKKLSVGEIIVSIKKVGCFPSYQKFGNMVFTEYGKCLYPDDSDDIGFDPFLRKCDKETPYPKITAFLARISLPPLAQTSHHHTNIHTEAAREYAKQIYLYGGDFVRIIGFVNGKFQDAGEYICGG